MERILLSLMMNEVKNPKYPVICLMEEQTDISDMGGTMRLGAYECILNQNTLAYNAYGSDKISERHRLDMKLITITEIFLKKMV